MGHALYTSDKADSPVTCREIALEEHRLAVSPIWKTEDNSISACRDWYPVSADSRQLVGISGSSSGPREDPVKR